MRCGIAQQIGESNRFRVISGRRKPCRRSGSLDLLRQQLAETIEVCGYDDSGNNWTSHNTYVLTYDEWNRPKETKVGTVTLSENHHDQYGRLERVDYSNGLSAHYVFDALDRVSKIYQTENNTEALTYEMIYNGDKKLPHEPRKLL